MTECSSSLPIILDTVRELTPQGEKVYLVGGAVRDLLLAKACHDMDFVVEGDVRPLARRLANHFNGDFFMMDAERQTARVILPVADGSRQNFDFAALRAADLEGDLRARDFTVNAIAINIHAPGKLIDPLGGAADLLAKTLRACSATAFLDDPLRVLRGVRLSLALGYRLEPDTTRLMRAAVPKLRRVSIERMRDELFRMLDCSQPAAAIRLLDQLGALQVILPEIGALKGVSQSAPHIWDVWEHTLAMLSDLQRLFVALVEPYDEDNSGNLVLGLAVMRLGRFREHLAAHFQRQLNPNRSLRALLGLAALYHDIAKPAARQENADGKIHFLEHETLGEGVTVRRAKALALSQAEVEHLALLVRLHMRVHFLVNTADTPTRRAIYRFFRAAGEVGVDLVLLSLADRLATEGYNLNVQTWERHLDICHALLEAWWEHPEPGLKPPRLINGHDLQSHFCLSPGQRIGECLEAIQEAQAVGEIATRDEALAFAQNWLNQVIEK